jgi:hypothetical protein
LVSDWDPDSPDCNPARYNRCLRYLHSKGKHQDVPLVRLRSRSLKDPVAAVER